MRLPLFASVAARFLAHEPRHRDGARLALATLLLWTRGRLAARDRPARLTATAGGRRVSFTAWTYIDMLIAREIFLDRTYRVPVDLTPRTIFDLGASSGISVRFLRALYPDAAIVAVEPDPGSFDRLTENVAGDDRTHVVRAAVGSEHGTATFYAQADGWGSSLEPRDGARPVDVEVVTLADLLQRRGEEEVDLLKIDIEGGEWPLLEAGAVQDVAHCLMGELHFDSDHTLADAERLLADFDVTFHATGGTRTSFTARRRERGPVNGRRAVPDASEGHNWEMRRSGRTPGPSGSRQRS
jgi:FkbM family methyltransferase